MDKLIDDVDANPKWRATGNRELRIRGLHQRHQKILSILESDLENAGHREAIAFLLECYASDPDAMRRAVEDVTFREMGR